MNFAEFFLNVTRRVAAINEAHISVLRRDDDKLDLELSIVKDYHVASVAFVSEDSPEEEFAAFDAKIDAVIQAIAEQDAEDAETKKQVRAVLEKLTPEDRLLIERPLPEDLPPEEQEKDDLHG